MNTEQITNTLGSLPNVTVVPTAEVETNTAVEVANGPNPYYVEAKPVAPLLYANALVVAGMLGVTLAPEDKDALMKMTDQGTMNKYIMELKNKPSPDIDKLYPEEEAALLKVSNNNRAPRYRTLKQELENFQSYIDKYTREVDSYISRSLAHRQEMQYYESLPGIDLITPIKQLLRSGTVKVSSISDSLICLTTRTIYCKHVDKSIGVNMVVNMGMYKIEIRTSDFYVTIKRHQDNIQLGGYYHPHVATDGVPCWGNIANQVAKYRAEAKVYELVTAAVQMLEAYNPDSPYRKLFFFDKERNPEKYGNLETQYVPAGEFYVSDHVALTHSPHDTHILETEDEDGNEVYIHEAFCAVYKSIPNERADNYAHIRTGDNTYTRISGVLDYYYCDEEGNRI